MSEAQRNFGTTEALLRENDASGEAAAGLGILLTRGASLRIPKGGLTLKIGPDGSLDASPLKLELSLDVVGLWLRASLAQLEVAQLAREQYLVIPPSDGDRIGPLLEAESVASMIAIMGAATAIEAFYSALKERSIRVAEVPVSKKGRSTRYRIISEAIRREFRFGAKSRTDIMVALRELYKFRDWSVHPNAAFTEPVRHPDLPIAVEWRHAAYRYVNAQHAVRIALSLLVQLPAFVRDPKSAVGKYIGGTCATLDELAASWRAKFGPLTGTDAS